MFLYWLHHLCIYSFLLFPPPVTPFVLLWALFLNLFQCDVFPSSSPRLFNLFIFLVMCFSNLYVLFQLLIHNSGILWDPCVPSLSSVLPAPLQTFCYTHTPPSLLLGSSLFSSPGFPQFFLSEKWSLCRFLRLAHMHTCLFYMRSCSHSVTLILATVAGKTAPTDAPLSLDRLPFGLKFLPVLLLHLPHARLPQTYKEITFSFPMSAFVPVFPSLQAVSLATCNPPLILTPHIHSFSLWLVSLQKVLSFYSIIKISPDCQS